MQGGYGSLPFKASDDGGAYLTTEIGVDIPELIGKV